MLLNSTNVVLAQCTSPPKSVAVARLLIPCLLYLLIPPKTVPPLDKDLGFPAMKLTLSRGGTGRSRSEQMFHLVRV